MRSALRFALMAMLIFSVGMEPAIGAGFGPRHASFEKPFPAAALYKEEALSTRVLASTGMTRSWRFKTVALSLGALAAAFLIIPSESSAAPLTESFVEVPLSGDFWTMSLTFFSGASMLAWAHHLHTRAKRDVDGRAARFFVVSSLGLFVFSALDFFSEFTALVLQPSWPLTYGLVASAIGLSIVGQSLSLWKNSGRAMHDAFHWIATVFVAFVTYQGISALKEEWPDEPLTQICASLTFATIFTGVSLLSIPTSKSWIRKPFLRGAAASALLVSAALLWYFGIWSPDEAGRLFIALSGAIGILAMAARTPPFSKTEPWKGLAMDDMGVPDILVQHLMRLEEEDMRKMTIPFLPEKIRTAAQAPAPHSVSRLGQKLLGTMEQHNEGRAIALLLQYFGFIENKLGAKFKILLSPEEEEIIPWLKDLVASVPAEAIGVKNNPDPRTFLELRKRHRVSGDQVDSFMRNLATAGFVHRSDVVSYGRTVWYMSMRGWWLLALDKLQKSGKGFSDANGPEVNALRGEDSGIQDPLVERVMKIDLALLSGGPKKIFLGRRVEKIRDVQAAIGQPVHSLAGLGYLFMNTVSNLKIGPQMETARHFLADLEEKLLEKFSLRLTSAQTDILPWLEDLQKAMQEGHERMPNFQEFVRLRKTAQPGLKIEEIRRRLTDLTKRGYVEPSVSNGDLPDTWAIASKGWWLLEIAKLKKSGAAMRPALRQKRRTKRAHEKEVLLPPAVAAPKTIVPIRRRYQWPTGYSVPRGIMSEFKGGTGFDLLSHILLWEPAISRAVQRKAEYGLYFVDEKNKLVELRENEQAPTTLDFHIVRRAA